MVGVRRMRIFNGKLYCSGGTYDTKDSAKRAANSWRKDGNLARVVFVPGAGYVVYAVSK